jgi:hypothetical protein
MKARIKASPVAEQKERNTMAKLPISRKIANLITIVALCYGAYLIVSTVVASLYGHYVARLAFGNR